MPRCRRSDPADPAATSPASRRYRDPEAFLRAIALGEEPATMAQRIRAAGMLLRAGVPVSDSPPKERARRDRAAAERQARETWEAIAASVRAKHAARTT